MPKTWGRLIGSLFFLCLSLGLGYFLYCLLLTGQNADTLRTIPAREISVDYGVVCDGYIVRDETVLPYDAGVFYSFVVSDGERVGKNTVLAYGFSNREQTAAYFVRNQLDARVKMLQAQQTAGSDIFDVARQNTVIADTLADYAAQRDDGWFVANDVLADRLRSQIARREYALGGGSLIDDIASLNARINTLPSTAPATTLRSGFAGYYCADTDGLENILTPDSLKQITAQGLLDAAASAAPTAGQVGKMVFGYDWYLAALVPADYAAELRDGRSYSIKLCGETVKVTLSRLDGENMAGVQLAVFYCETGLNEMGLQRSQTVKLITTTITGFRVPSSGLRVVGGAEGVYVLRGAEVKFVPVDVLHSGGNYYIVRANYDTTKELFYNDEIIVGGQDLYDGKVYN